MNSLVPAETASSCLVEDVGQVQESIGTWTALTVLRRMGGTWVAVVSVAWATVALASEIVSLAALDFVCSGSCSTVEDSEMGLTS